MKSSTKNLTSDLKRNDLTYYDDIMAQRPDATNIKLSLHKSSFKEKRIMSTLILDGNWKQHPVYTKYYFCDDGRVVSYCKKNPRQIFGTTAGQQKYRAIPVDGSKKIYIHRTICELFNGLPKNGEICRHLDGNKYNNAASNLSWGSTYDNCQDMILHGNALVGEKNPMAKLTEEQVKQIRSIREKLKVPYYQIAKMYGVSTMTAFRAATKRSWK